MIDMLNENKKMIAEPINHLYYFNSHTKSDEEVVRTFISRQEVFQQILVRIADENERSIPQHYILIGSRGMGKTTLLRRLEIELRKGELSGKFIPILFPEEQYNIDRLSKFWLNTIDALADTLEQEHHSSDADVLDSQIKALKNIDDEGKLSDEAYSVLINACKKYNRRPVFLIDNIDIVFDGIPVEQKFKLRKLITSNGAPIFLGASSENPKEDNNYDAPFYDAFDNIYLANLSQEEMRNLLLGLAKQTGRDEALNSIYAETAQLDALHSLSGGNPRVAVFMFQLIVNGFSDKIFENLNALLDLITPLYKSNFEQLPKQAQIIVDALALNWDPCDLERLNGLTRLANNQLSAQLDRLIKMGWVERASRFSAEKNIISVKNKNYSIRERFFNIWYIMRRASRRERGDLKSLTCFLETFYTPQHLLLEKERIIGLIKQHLDVDQVTYALALSRAHHAQMEHNEMEQEIYMEIISKAEGDQTLIAEYVDPGLVPENVYFDYLLSSFGKTIDYVDGLSEQGNYDKALHLMNLYMEKEGGSGYILTKIGTIYEKMGEISSAESSFKRALTFNADYDYALVKLGKLYAEMEKYDEAEAALLAALKLNVNDAYTLNSLALLYTDNNQFDKAEKIFLRLIDENPEYAYGWSNFADFLMGLDRYDQAELVLKEGIVHHPNEPFLLFSLVNFNIHIKQFAKAIDYGLRAVKEMPEAEYMWGVLGRAYYAEGQWQQAREAFSRAAAMAEDDKFYLELYGDASLKLKDYGSAKDAFLRSIKKDPKNARVWLKLGRIYHYHLRIREEALKAYKKSLSINKKNAEAYVHLGQLYHYVLKDSKHALTSYYKALSIKPDLIFVKMKLAELLKNNLEEYLKAEALYKEVLDKEPLHIEALVGLVSLLRDKMSRTEEALDIVEKIGDLGDKGGVVWLMQRAIAASIRDNWGQAKTLLSEIFDDVDEFRIDTHKVLLDIVNGMAVLQGLGFGKHLIKLFEDRFVDTFYRPFAEAIIGLEQGNVQYFLNIAPEIRTVSEQIYHSMLDYQRTNVI